MYLSVDLEVQVEQVAPGRRSLGHEIHIGAGDGSGPGSFTFRMDLEVSQIPFAQRNQVPVRAQVRLQPVTGLPSLVTVTLSMACSLALSVPVSVTLKPSTSSAADSWAGTEGVNWPATWSDVGVGIQANAVERIHDRFSRTGDRHCLPPGLPGLLGGSTLG